MPTRWVRPNADWKADWSENPAGAMYSLLNENVVPLAAPADVASNYIFSTTNSQEAWVDFDSFTLGASEQVLRIRGWVYFTLDTAGLPGGVYLKDHGSPEKSYTGGAPAPTFTGAGTSWLAHTYVPATPTEITQANLDNLAMVIQRLTGTGEARAYAAAIEITTVDTSLPYVQYVASGARTENAGSGNVSNVPSAAGTTNNDVEVMEILARDNVTVTLPAGWTKKAEINNGTGMRTTVAWRRFATGNSTTTTITHSGGNVANAQIHCYRGCVTTGDPFEATNQRTSGPNPGQGTYGELGLTTLTAQCRVIHVLHVGDDSTAAAGAGVSSRDTNGTGFGDIRERVDWETATGNDASGAVYDYFVPDAQAVTGIALIFSPTASAVATEWVGALKPQTGSDTTPPVPNVTSVSRSRISAQSGVDSSTVEFQVNEACQAWKIKIVSGAGDVHTSGTQVEAGGAIAANTTISMSITDDELLAAAGAQGTYLLKLFTQDTAGNWST